MLNIFVFYFVFFYYFSIIGQEVESQINDDFNRVGLILENDVFNRTDRYYTNGIILSFSSPNFENTFIFGLFSDSKPNQFDRYGIGFEHKIYTPIDKSNVIDLEDDRPFASYFLFNLHKETRKIKSKSANYFQIGVGLIGTEAKGEYIKK